MFGERRGFGWSAVWSALVLVAAAVPAQALVIDATYDTTVTSSPEKAQIEAAFNTIISQYEAMLTNPVSVSITLELSSSVDLGENYTDRADITYSQFRTALGSAGTGGNQLAETEFLTLPNQTLAPVGGTSNVELSLANARALGFSESNGNPDATLLISSGNPSTTVQYARVDGQVGTGNFDFTGVAEHELDEILGLGSALNGCGESPCVRPEDFLRYEQNSTTRSYTTSASATAFLSINGGASDLVQLSQDPFGDYGDFYSPGPDEPATTPCTARVQNAFSCPGMVSSTSRNSTEIQALAAMGWDTRFSTSTTNTTWLVNCTNGTIASTGAVVTATTIVTGPLGALLGTPSGPATFGQSPAPGDVVEITGICVEDATVSTSDLMLTNSEGPDGYAGDVSDGDGVQGQLEINGAQRIVITGLLLGDFDNSFTFASAGDLATLFIHDGATVTLMHTDSDNSPSFGVLARRGAAVTFFDDNFYYDGLDNGAPGIAVLTNSKAMFGADDGSLSVVVHGSGGDGVEAEIGSSVVFHAAQLTMNGNRQLFLQGASSARLSGSAATIDMASDSTTCQALQGTACNTAVEVVGSSMLRLENGASVSALDSGSPVGAIALSQGSALLTQGATIQALAAASPTVAAGENSVIALAGGNQICSVACSSATTGIVVALDHVSTLIQVAPAEFGYAAAQDMLFGNGSVNLQSTVDLGLGVIGSSPSVAWTTVNSTTSGIVVAQNSSFRLQGGATIAGEGGLQLSQGSNGFFNVANGGTNSIAGTVTCPFTNIPGAHVAGATAVSPAVALSTNFFATPAKTCLPF